MLNEQYLLVAISFVMIQYLIVAVVATGWGGGGEALSHE